MTTPTTAISDKKFPGGKFDPWTNRLARDVRNTLSESFLMALSQMEPSAYRDEADIWQTKNPSEIYLEYIQDRLQRYDRVIEQIKAQHLDDPLLQSLPIWNNGLFFEFHDHLEGIWMQAAGNERQALKGMIKAAAVFAHHEYNHEAAVKSLALKSYDLVQQYSDCLTFIKNLDVLAQKLKTLDPDPPRLENPALR
jgi:hypothetical protein